MRDESQLRAVATELDGLVTAIVRVGLSQAHDALSVEAALSRLIESAATPVPPVIVTWVGRLRQALLAGDTSAGVDLLAGAVWLRDAVRARNSGDAEDCVAAWFGPSDARPVTRLEDALLIEIARERLDGLQRFALRRRYLVDIARREILVEDTSRAAEANAPASVGPCPRAVQVGLAEVDPAWPHRRIRILQYSVQVDITQSRWAALVALAERDLEKTRSAYAERAASMRGMLGPGVLLAPHRFVQSLPMFLEDERGERLALASSRAEQRALEALLGGGELRVLFGRLTPRMGHLTVVPLSVLIERNAQLVFRRLV